MHKRGWQEHTSLTLLSPCLDLTYTHEQEMQALQDKDPMLQFDRIKMITDVWRGELPASHPWVSPIFGDLQCLNNIGVYYGSNEILKVDVELFREALKKIGKTAEIHEYEGMFHTFPLFPVPQGFQALKKIVQKIKCAIIIIINLIKISSGRSGVRIPHGAATVNYAQA